MKKYIFTSLLLCFFLNVTSQGIKKQYSLDSIQKLRALSKSSQYNTETQKEYAELAVELSEKSKVDSTIIKSKLNLALVYLNMDYYKTFKALNNNIIDIAEKTGDSLAVTYAYHNLGWYYQVKAKQDSSYWCYNKVRKIYRNYGDKRNEAEVLVNMVSIQLAEKDFVGAEINTVEAIKLAEQLPKTQNNIDTMWTLFNMIGFISGELGFYDEAIEYYQKSLEIVKDSNNYIEYENYVLSNIAVDYNKNKQYDKAIEINNSFLKNRNIKAEDPSFYAKILVNQAVAKYKVRTDYNYTEVDTLFSSALQISQEIDDPIMESSIALDMANFYYSNSQIPEANKFADRSLSLALETKSNVYTLGALKLKSNLENGEISKNYFNRYVKLNDSLIKKERAIRNKFARIQFETEEIKAENVQISRERLLFLGLSIGLVLVILLIYIVVTQRAKNKELEFVQQQQETNEEIYNLMLVQQDKIDEGRAKEKKRISRELHDGILGRLFGTRLSLDSLNLVNTDDARKSRGDYINQLQVIESDIRKISHDLSADFISESGFIDIIEALIETQMKAYGLTFEFNHDSEIDWEGISNKNKIHIYRILQESMQNIYKHAQASHVKIGFEKKNSVILLSIEDNGIGFNTAKARKGIGLKNIDSRIRELGGKAEIYSKINKGTTVKISIPVDIL